MLLCSASCHKPILGIIIWVFQKCLLYDGENIGRYITTSGKFKGFFNESQKYILNLSVNG